ncbi:MAG TPA: pitrilysin family protein [Gemmatimonadales bacterium]|nr:pitrilysin family protein [Gemmatimonadales bacterium]
MRSTGWMIALVSLAISLVTPPPPLHAVQDSSLTRAVHVASLENGLQVIVAESHTVALATVLLAVRNGAFTQDSAEQGLAHLYEHILFRSYHHDPSAFGVEATYLKGSYNGATSDEVVYYYISLPSENVDGGLRLIARLIQEADFSNLDLKEERPVVLNELQRGESDPEERLDRQVSRALWGRSWSRKDVSGDSGSLAAITLDRLRATYARYYLPNNAALIVTGDVANDRVVERARQLFGEWKAGPDPFAARPIPPVAPRDASTAILVADNVLDVTIRVALLGPSVGTDTAATYAADVLFDLLDNPTSAFQRRMVTNGPFQALSGSYLTRDHTGPIEFVGKTTPGRAREAVLALIDELDRLGSLSDITEEDLANAKKRRRIRGALAVERTALLAPQLAFWWSSAGMDYYLTYHPRLTSRTLQDLRKFAADYVIGKPRVIGVLAPPFTIQSLASALKQATHQTGP